MTKTTIEWTAADELELTLAQRDYEQKKALATKAHNEKYDAERTLNRIEQRKALSEYEPGWYYNDATEKPVFLSSNGKWGDGQFDFVRPPAGPLTRMTLTGE